mmetsp:Transcript_19595/g.28275  ORF Transcript_19595/g.28275 Transcript_19595/m.28275 type:complete len:206 (-) Transcript_19595:245-862(-)
MKTEIVATALLAAAGVNAFVPTKSLNVASSTRATKAAVSMEFAGGMIGADGPEPGSKNFDPFKLSEKAPENLKWYREAEIKHGRMCMLATLGLIVPSFLRVPGDIYQGVGVVEAHNAMVSAGPMWQLLLWISVAEVCAIPALTNMNEKDRAPGDYGFDPANLGGNPAKLERYKLAELKNGRLAMLAFSGMITQAALTGNEFPFLY